MSERAGLALVKTTAEERESGESLALSCVQGDTQGGGGQLRSRLRARGADSRGPPAVQGGETSAAEHGTPADPCCIRTEGPAQRAEAA